MIKYITLSLIVFTQFFTALNHKYYVGLTEIKFNPDKERLEIISRLFYNDFEKVLKARYGKDIVLKPSEQSKNVETFIKMYFDKKLSITTDNQVQTISYLGYKFDEDRINIYLKITNIQNFKNIKVQNLLLTDVFEDQKNIVHCFKLQQKKSVLLTRFDSEAVLKFN
ncbi:DUF6702 family protein [Flavobacterium sp. CS20]|jgi:hypothetical protein|uniref:DUF6702 family protein n=1 Tax=Flavobacterium sp. CS20 TaxID=2775246 RepID=UPI001B39ECFA|nr:DUF6702 family protein [Flavobacterium sp. CS20]QTY26637.1 hypothetical protein IGB25_12130 [Flavobacterium sp. CS20]